MAFAQGLAQQPPDRNEIRRLVRTVVQRLFTSE
jgi:hypothetical protein